MKKQAAGNLASAFSQREQRERVELIRIGRRMFDHPGWANAAEILFNNLTITACEKSTPLGRIPMISGEGGGPRFPIMFFADQRSRDRHMEWQLWMRLEQLYPNQQIAAAVERRLI